MLNHPNLRTFLALAVSLMAHAAIVAWLVWTVTMPKLGIEFELPSEVEFGVVEGTEVSLPSASASPTTPQEESASNATGQGDVPATDKPSADHKKDKQPKLYRRASYLFHQRIGGPFVIIGLT